MASAAGVPHGVSTFFTTISKRATWLSFALAILLMILGCLAILLPVAMSIGVVIVLCWLLMIGGVVQMIDAFRGPGIWHFVWKFALAGAYFLTGLYLRLHLAIGLATLTLALVLFFVVQGLIDISIYIRIHKTGAYVPLLLHGIITLVLGLMIWRHWPGASLWVIGTLVGIHMIVTGTTRLMLTTAIWRAAKKIPQETS